MPVGSGRCLHILSINITRPQVPRVRPRRAVRARMHGAGRARGSVRTRALIERYRGAHPRISPGLAQGRWGCPSGTRAHSTSRSARVAPCRPYIRARTARQGRTRGVPAVVLAPATPRGRGTVVRIKRAKLQIGSTGAFFGMVKILIRRITLPAGFHDSNCHRYSRKPVFVALRHC